MTDDYILGFIAFPFAIWKDADCGLCDYPDLTTWRHAPFGVRHRDADWCRGFDAAHRSALLKRRNFVQRSMLAVHRGPGAPPRPKPVSLAARVRDSGNDW